MTRTTPWTPEQLLALLDGLGIPHVTHAHPPLFTVAESQALRGTLPGGHAKSLLLRAKSGAMVLLVAEENRRIPMGPFGRAVGEGRLSFAGEEDLLRLLGVRPGAATPFGLVHDTAHELRVVLDRGLVEGHATLNFHPLVNTATTAIPAEGLDRFLAHTGHRAARMDLDTLA